MYGLKEKKEKNLTQHDIIDIFKKEIKDYKVSLGNLDKTQKEKIEWNFARGVNIITDRIDKITSNKKEDEKIIPDEIKNRLVEFRKKLADPNVELTSTEVDELASLLDYVFDTNHFIIVLEQEDLLALKESIDDTKKLETTTKKKLSTLQKTIPQNVETQKAVELAKKAEEYGEKLKGFKEKHSYWTKVLLHLIPKPILAIIFKTDINYSPENKLQDLVKKFKLDQQKLGPILKNMSDFLVNIGIWIFDMPYVSKLFGVPKEMQDFLHNIKKDFGKLSPEQLAQIKAMMGNSGLDVKKVVEGVKELSPDKLSEGKKRLLNFMEKKGTEWFGVENSKKEKYKKALSKWFDKISSDKQINGFINDILTGKVQLEKLNLDQILTGLGTGIKGAVELLNVLYEENIISLSQIGLKIVKTGGEIFLQTALFFPHAISTFLGNYKLKDLYDKLKNQELADVNKDMFLVMIYRAINTPPFSILQHLASWPGYIISAVANMGESVTKGKIFLEALKGDSINNQLKLLEEIEKEIKPRQGSIYEGIRKSLEFYRKGITVSYIYGKARNYSEFEQMIKKAGLENDDRIKTLLKELSKSYEPTKIIAFVDSMKGEITAISTSEKYAGKLFLTEKTRAELGGMFGHTNFFKNTMESLSKSLEANSNILRQPVLLSKFEKWVKKAKSSYASAGNTKLLDLSRLTGDVNTFKEFTNDLKIFAKHSPELLKFFFRNSPVILLGSDMIESVKKGDLNDVFKTYMEFVPLIGPFVFVMGKYKEGTLTLTDIGGTAVWFGLDGWLVMNLKNKNLLRLVAMPIIDTSKFLGYSTDIIARYSKLAGFEKISRLKLKGRLAIAGIVLAAIYGLYKYLSEDDKKNANETVKILANLSSKPGGLELVNNEIIKNWNKYSDDLKKQLIVAFVGYYMNLDPTSLDKYIESVEIDKNKLTITFDDEQKSKPFVKNKLLEIKPIISQMSKKLNIEIVVS